MTTTPDATARADAAPPADFDALLLLSFGGPEAPDEVVPFLENVTRGSGIPRERLAEVGKHYFLFGGRSPINDQNRALIDTLRRELDGRGVPVPIYWGNRNWRPYVSEALEALIADGHRTVRVLTTSAYPSYSGCRSYREDLAAALGGLSGVPDDLVFTRVGNYGLDESFVAANALALSAALRELPDARIVFVTHSIPTEMNETSGPAGGAYVAWHEEVARRVVASVAPGADYDLVFCSRSGRPGQPWLEPDVNDHLRDLAGRGVTRVVLAPIGFVSDHMEVIYDLDTQARETCDQEGIAMVRAATAGVLPGFVRGLVDRVLAAGRRDAAGPDDGCGGVCASPCGAEVCCPNLRRPGTPAVG